MQEFSYWINRATMDLNRGTFEAWNLPEDAGKIVARWMCNVARLWAFLKP